ncbi:YacL family protein [Psychrosphaera sp. B3R10]|uniref:YacL family protein n=1 Tax=unclassified Psychrosphaera TaxID=2641570 RepID=UPI001C082B2A|nr:MULTISPECIES: YacL family protein [unclassified Psychrosphaera]MBU2882947.1 YacL family protein [Psychrosphaera sp. I2R16]MBU2991344.1 YacL family protein [Psychrosphaera sp. B3R10]
MDFQFVYDRRLKRHFLELGGEYTVVANFFNDELAPAGMSISVLQTLREQLLKNSGVLLGQEWSVNIEAEELTIYHNNYAEHLENLVTERDEDEDMRQEKTEDESEYDVFLGDHILRCGKDDLIYLIDKWIDFIQE